MHNKFQAGLEPAISAFSLRSCEKEIKLVLSVGEPAEGIDATTGWGTTPGLSGLKPMGTGGLRLIWSNPTETTTSHDTTTRFALVLLVVFAVVVAVDVAIVPVLVVPAIFWSRPSTCSIARAWF